MPFQVSPGVLVREINYSNIIPGVSTSIGAVVGPLAWGPVDEIMTFGYEKEVVERTGKPTDDTFQTFFAIADFLAYSNHIKAVRVVGDDAKNAICGGVGTGATVTTTILNGEVSSFVFVARGTGYVVGDIVSIDGGLTPALFRVEDIDVDGAIEDAELLTNGTGYSAGTGVETTVQGAILVKNDEDFEDSVYLPEVMGKFPGKLGNSLVFSSARASEFDNWRFKERFIVPPAANVQRFDGVAGQKVFTLSKAAPTDTVVTVDGIKIDNGEQPGEYTISGTTLTFHTDDETFEANGSTNVFTLLNTTAISTEGAVVKLDGDTVERYDGIGDVPVGKVRVEGNTVEFGLNQSKFSGDSVTSVFTIVGVTKPSDIQIYLDGSLVDQVSADPVDGECVVATSGSNTTITFPAGSQPGIGKGNLVAKWGYPASGDDVLVEYGFPKAGADMVKVFDTQTQIHAVVADKDGAWTGEEYAIMERYEFLSLSPTSVAYDGTSDYYQTRINRVSNFVRVSNITYHSEKALSGGVDDDKIMEGITPAKLQAGYNLFVDADEIEVSHIIGCGYDKATLVHILSNIVEVRRDCVLYYSIPRENIVNNRGNELKDSLQFKRDMPGSSYKHVDTGWKWRYDLYNDKYRWVSCSADSAGIYAWTHNNDNPWKSGAGFNRGRVRNVVKLAWSPKKYERDELYPNNINPITHFANEGPILYGDKTGESKPSAFDHMNVRWLFIVLEKAIARAAKYYLFENNTEFTRNRFKNMITPFLRDIKGKDGIEDFEVKCDDKNNPESVRARNEFVADIKIKPVYSINYITLNFVAVGPDVTFEEIPAQL